jgi:hypothetical protein
MNSTWCKVVVPAAVLSMLLVGVPVGDTSGPAAGTPATPNAAVHKQETNATSGAAPGAPGAEGKQGTESGPQPKTSTGAGQPTTPKQ